MANSKPSRSPIEIPPKEPQTMMQVVGYGARLWVRSFGLALPFALLISIINMALQFGMKPYTNALKQAAQAAQASHSGTALALTEGQLETHQSPLMLLIFFAFIVISLLLHAGMTYRINAAVNKNVLSFDKALLIACRKVLPIVGVYCLTVIMIAAGLMLLVIPGIMVMFYLICAHILVVLTDLGVIESIRESFRLVSGNFWRVVGIFILTALLYLGISIIFGIVIGLLFAVLQLFLGDLLLPVKENAGIFFGGFMLLFLYPLLTTCLLSLYYDLQRRKSDKPSHHIAA